MFLGRLVRFVSVLVAVLAVAFITMAAVGAAAGGSTSTLKSTTTISIGGRATLTQPGNPLGRGVNVTITYSCFPGFGGGKGGYPGGGAFGNVRVTDLSGNQGFGSWTPTCNDTRQTAVVFAPGFFVAGAGAASAFVCGFDCNGTSREIRIS